MQPDLQRGFRLHDRTVLPEQNRISGDGEDAHVVPRTMAVLVCLAEHAGEVVTREFMDEHVWRGSVVTDHALTSCISELRNHLGDARGESRFIETVPKRGYRLIAPVTPLEGQVEPEARSSSRGLLRIALPLGLAVVVIVIAGVWWATHTGSGVGGAGFEHVSRPAAPSTSATVAVTAVAPAPVLVEPIPAKSIAVLPFTNEGRKQDEQFFSDGLSEGLIHALSQFDGLKVISRNSAFQFRDSKDDAKTVGKKLGVAYLLEGTVQRVGGAVRITAALVSASDGSIVWSQRYDKPYKDLFALQDAITKAAADTLKAKLLIADGAVTQSDRPPSGDLAAYTAYQHGVAYYTLGTEAGFRQAIDAFEKAIRLDPKYVAAYAQLSVRWAGLASQFLDGEQAQQAYEHARLAVKTALALDPDSSLAHQAHGNLLLRADMDWTSAEAEYRRALQLAPNNNQAQFSLGSVLATLGQSRRAVALTLQALNGDPRNAVWYQWLAYYLVATGQLEQARTAINTAIALQPGAAAFYKELTVIEVLRGDAQAARVAAQQEPPGAWHDIAMALATQIGSDRVTADVALQRLIRKNAEFASYQIAEAYALRKDPDAMFNWLDRALVKRDPGIRELLWDPLILRYRDDPRFAAFCEKVGLPTTTDAVPMK